MKDCCQQPEPGSTVTATLLPNPTRKSGDKATATIVLVGNPNVGKSTLFNHLTGARQKVINAPGTTVEVLDGFWSGQNMRVLDLPGTYSLLPQSPDEQVVVDTLAGLPGTLSDPRLGLGIDLAVVLLDATAMTRSLYLLGQVAQTGIPHICVLTMIDVARAQGEQPDPAALSQALGVPVVSTDPRRGQGLDSLTSTVRQALKNQPRIRSLQPDPLAPGYNPVAGAQALSAPTSLAVHELGPTELLAEAVGPQANSAACTDSSARQPCCEENRPGTCCNNNNFLPEDVPFRDAAKQAESSENTPADSPRSTTTTSATTPSPSSSTSLSPNSTVQPLEELERAEELFVWVAEIESKTGEAREAAQSLTRSDKADRLLLNPVAGVAVFMVLVWAIFQLTTTFAAVFQTWFEEFFTGPIANIVAAVLNAVALTQPWIHGLLIDGVVGGLAVVASFVPLMFIMFLAISLLEDSGYMARVAFLGDRLMRKIGLDGRVIMPLIVGFGCNLPSLAATRSIPEAKQRLVTSIIIPYASCSARLVIYLMMARIFFPTWAGTVVFAMYVLSVVMMVLGALVLKPFVTKNHNKAPLLLVLPAYQTPRALVMLQSTWNRTWSFIKGAGKIIVGMTVVIWLLGATPVVAGYSFADDELPMANSAYGAVAKAISPVFEPAGFNDWHMAGALLTGFIAKETLISSIAVSYTMDPAVKEYSAGDAEEGGTDLGDLKELVRDTMVASAGSHAHAALAAFGFIVFVLTYTPCLATVAEQVRQIGWRWAIGATIVQLIAAWVLAVLIFQIGGLFL
ncbi:MAG: ferrous iron transport protein B [Actinomycetaceae bacterium]|nr:ferrous iron transport protein B [Actinomycetaceae bacterium]